MTADLDLSPEAVERRLFSQERQDQISHYDRGRAVGRDEAMAETAPLIRKLSEQASALAAENARLRAERDEQRERAEEAESEITRAQEQVSAEFEGDCWKAMRNLLDRTCFDWPEYGDDGVTADDAHQWIVEELDRLEAERDAAWQAGAEAMREAAAAAAVNVHNVRIIGCRMGSDWISGHRIGSYDAYGAIRVLPLPDQPKEGS